MPRQAAGASTASAQRAGSSDNHSRSPSVALAAGAPGTVGAAGERAIGSRGAAATRTALTGWRAWFVAAAVLCAYLLPGILGHDPWKQDETYTFGIIQHMLESGDFVVPTNAGQPFLEKPPLYDWVATGFAWLFPASCRCTTPPGLRAPFAALAFGFTARAARVATGAARWLELPVIGTVALCAGSLVIIKHSHDLMTDVALMAGAAMGFAGCSNS